MPRRCARQRLGTVAALALSVLLSGIVPLPAVRAVGFPPLPNIEYGRELLGNLSAPSIAPGASGRISFTVEDPPAMAATLSSISVTLQVYAFNGFPGDATALLPVANAPVLTNGTASAESVNVTDPSPLAPGAVWSSGIGLASSAATPSGAFAVRTAIEFRANSTVYRLESRGWFSASLWAEATEFANSTNGTPTLNLSVLQVSGVVPETAVLVSASDWPWILGGLLAATFVLVAAAAWVYYRRGPGSTVGTR